MFRAELAKLKRSATWIVAVALPLAAVTTGTVNFAGNRDQLEAGWSSYTSQVTLFYGLLFSSVGIGILASTVWRVEHQGGNWNQLVVGTERLYSLVLAKTAAVILLGAVMNCTLAVAAYALGIIVLRLPGPVPADLAVVMVIASVAAAPLAAVQSLLSMVLRSFAAPVAVCFAGCVLAVASVTSTGLRPLSYVVPQALNTRALNLGSSALAGNVGLRLDDIASLIVPALILAVAFLGLAVVALRRIKLR